MRHLLLWAALLAGLGLSSCYNADSDEDGIDDHCYLIFWTDQSPANFDVYINGIFQGKVNRSHETMLFCGRRGTVDLYYNEASVEVNYSVNRNGTLYRQGRISVSGCTKVKL